MKNNNKVIEVYFIEKNIENGDYMSKDLFYNYNKIATDNYELKKKYDKIKDIENSKKHKVIMDKYDFLADKELDGIDISEMYGMEVSKERTRASRTIRYYHYRRCNETTIKEKERWGIDFLKMALNKSKNPVVSCSFGIDSIVSLYMTRKALKELGRDPSDIKVVWNDTLNEFPEVRKYANELSQKYSLNIITTKPDIPLKKVIDSHGGVDSSYFFTRKGDRRNGLPLSEKCCATLKHKPMKKAIKNNDWDLVINGLRADESTQRLRAGLRDGEFFYSKSEWKAYVCRPILWMTESDIWKYVYSEDIPYNKLYDMNTIMKYPINNHDIINKNEEIIINSGIDLDLLKSESLSNVNRMQAIILKKIGYEIFTPRTGCMQCPIPVKYGYLHWMRLNYPKVFNSMIYNLGYGETLLGMIPNETKEEIKYILGVNLNENNAHEYIRDILEVKPCLFDKF